MKYRRREILSAIEKKLLLLSSGHHLLFLHFIVMLNIEEKLNVQSFNSSRNYKKLSNIYF